MKITTRIGSLLDVPAGHIVHGCNALGVMGSGVALAIREKWPHVYEDYAAKRFLVLGEAYPVPVNKNLVVWNAITQAHCGQGKQISYDAMEECFARVNDVMGKATKFCKDVPQEIHIPLIGCALGGGKWPIVEAIIENTVDYPVTLWKLE